VQRLQKNFRPRSSKFSLEQKKRIIMACLNTVGFRAVDGIFDIPRMSVFCIIKKLGTKIEEIKTKEIKDEKIIKNPPSRRTIYLRREKNKPSKNMDGSK
jgi:hypothetical protein